MGEMVTAKSSMQASAQRSGLGLALWAGVGVLALGSARWLGERVPAASQAGYWLGVVGGVAMLLLFAYPVRKRARWLRNAGAPKLWFVAHMALGIGGPWLILVHCGLRVGSLNAAVALYSMLVVAASGVVGRFLYVRIHHGLSGQKAQLRDCRLALQAHHQDEGGTAALPPEVAARLDAFEQQALAQTTRSGVSVWRLLGWGWPAWQALRTVRALIAQAELPLLVQVARTHDARAERICRARWRALARERVRLVLRVVQFSAWERLFALWHVLHIPFVYVMVICAIAHVVAVHAY